jgi:hypothetical protein
MMLGGGYRTASASNGTEEVTITGTGPAFTLAIGGALVDNVILFGQLNFASALEPEVRSSTLGTMTLTNTDVDFFGLGGGLAYYVVPVNLYIAGALLMSQLQVSRQGNSDNSADVTDEGMGLDLTVGKEWWVSSNWGLGLAAQFFVARMPDAGSNVTGQRVHWNAVATTLAFSATFN